MEQKIFTDTAGLDGYLRETGKIMLVCDGSIEYLKLNEYFKGLPEVTRFSDFTPNPQYESVVSGVRLLKQIGADTIIAVGGGSAMDVAKCIKLFSNMNENESFLEQRIVPNNVRLIAVPTTAGTGSEATRFAVIYYNGEKQSITHETAIPEAILMEPSVLDTLPEYQRKATMLDAFCHGIESFWSVNSTDESREYSKEALRLITEHHPSYLKNESSGNAAMLKAANIAGKAINITQTTAGHAMCYKLTSLYGIAHGHAAALCVSELWPYMIEHTDLCVDPRGKEYLENTLDEIAKALGFTSDKEAAGYFKEFVEKLGLKRPRPNNGDYEILKKSVNPVRLKNHPIKLTDGAISELYHRILD